MASKTIGLNDEQVSSFKQAKLRLQQELENPDLNDNAAVEKLCEMYLNGDLSENSDADAAESEAQA